VKCTERAPSKNKTEIVVCVVKSPRERLRVGKGGRRVLSDIISEGTQNISPPELEKEGGKLFGNKKKR